MFNRRLMKEDQMGLGENLGESMRKGRSGTRGSSEFTTIREGEGIHSTLTFDYVFHKSKNKEGLKIRPID